MHFLVYFIYATAGLLTIYLLLINIYWFWFNKLKPFAFTSNEKSTTRFSVIIPARNEEENINNCIQSILSNKYPDHLYEIIVADDFSDDATPQIVESLLKKHSNIKLIQLKNLITKNINSYKKKAIEIAISESKFEWIITTDADCIVPKKWLQLFNAFIQNNKTVFVAAPVMFNRCDSFLSIFQCLDFISLQGITAASVPAGFHSMCNGANLAYNKSVFNEVDGFKNADEIASGDDMLLMHKIKEKYPDEIGYLFSKKAIVKTAPMQGWKSFFNQRIRWASKATNYNDKKIFIVLLLVYVCNLFLFTFFFICLFQPKLFLILLMFVLTKALFEMPFMYRVSKFYSLQKLMFWFIVMQPFHILYTVFSGFLGKFGTYKWKGRKVK